MGLRLTVRVGPENFMTLTVQYLTYSIVNTVRRVTFTGCNDCFHEL